MWFTFKRRKNFDLEFKENMACKDEILKEYKGIRHEYNNMLQSIICLIEEEEWEELKNYKDKLLEKTKVLNRNNLTQLVKLKNKTILNLVYKLLIKDKEAGVTIYLTIYNDIDDINFYGVKVYKVLEEYLNCAYEVATLEGMQVDLKISGNKEGIRFAFENTYSAKGFNNISELNKTKRKFKAKNIFFNTSIETDMLIQEILIST